MKKQMRGIFSIFICMIMFFLCVCMKESSSNIPMEKNESPLILPEIQSWNGGYGFVDFTSFKYIYIESPDMYEIAETLQNEILDSLGITLEISFEHKKHAIFLQYKKHGEAEEYEITVNQKKIVIEGTDLDGIFWGSRTLLQIAMEDRLLPCGDIVDSPSYCLRGIHIDVARKPVSLKTLKEVILLMSWYKMNELHLHLNDNALLCYSDKADSFDTVYDAYSAFRLDSEVRNEEGISITSIDYSYTKEDFKELVDFAEKYHVKIVPEIDTPAHSLAITKVFPELGLNYYPDAADSMDLKNPKTLETVKAIWDEYVDGEDAWFKKCDVVHLGMDESYVSEDDYCTYYNALTSYLIEKGKTVRVWGSFSKMQSEIPINTENVQLNIWNLYWTNAADMIDKGFDIINSLSAHLYIIPAGGYDYLDKEYIYNSFEPCIFEEGGDECYEFDPENKQILGASIFVWNDFCDNIDYGITEYDIYHRILDILPYFSQKVWSHTNTLSYDEYTKAIESIKSIPVSSYQRENSEEGNKQLVPDYEITFELCLDNEDYFDKHVLFKNNAEYGAHALSLLKNDETYQLLLEKENKEHLFNTYAFEKGKHYTIKIVGNVGSTTLYVDNVLIQTIGTNVKFEEHCTFIFPLETISDYVSEIQY